MLSVVWDSFCRALIRFFDNRFVKESKIDFYQIEISRLHQQINRLLDERAPKQIREEVIDEGPQIAMPPIESSFARRTRLERESREKWEQSVKEAHEKLQAEKRQQSTEELEKSVGVI